MFWEKGSKSATLRAGGRQLHLVGTHAAYMRPLKGWNADRGAIAAATRDLPHGALCLDVGAHIGLTAISLAAQRPDCRIVAFEPLPVAADCLRRNLQANQISNVEVVEAAVADHADGVGFNEDNGPWSIAVGSAARSRSLRLDDAVSGRPAFIKIDVEGHEPNVLAGATRVLANALVLMEFNTWTLLVHRYDPIAFAEAVLGSADVVGAFRGEHSVPAPTDAGTLVHTNMMEHGCVTDLLFRLHHALPPLEIMVGRAVQPAP